jgi:uncharacterized protein
VTVAEESSIGWVDLTVADADRLRDFYRDVVGWTAEPVDMGGYSDWLMRSREGAAVAGICHRRGSNAALPPVWLVYLTVPDLDASLARCGELGGKVVVEPQEMGGMGRYSVVADPAGAVCALFERAKS